MICKVQRLFGQRVLNLTLKSGNVHYSFVFLLMEYLGYLLF